jgi:hypothetical protein
LLPSAELNDNQIKDEVNEAYSAHGEMRNACKILIGSLKKRDHMEDLGVDRSIVLKWIIGKLGRRVCLGFCWFRIGTGGGPL